MPGVLLCCLARQAHRGAPLAGVLLCSSTHQALKGAPWVGSYSLVQHVRRLMGQPLYCSAASAGVLQERGYGDDFTPYTWLSSILPCFHGCLAFFHRHFPPQFPPSHPLNQSLWSQQQPSPGVAPQSLNSNSQPLHLPADWRPCAGNVWLWQGLSDSRSI